jgi:hypothetical protein
MTLAPPLFTSQMELKYAKINQKVATLQKQSDFINVGNVFQKKVAKKPRAQEKERPNLCFS